MMMFRKIRIRDDGGGDIITYFFGKSYVCVQATTSSKNSCVEDENDYDGPADSDDDGGADDDRGET